MGRWRFLSEVYTGRRDEVAFGASAGSSFPASSTPTPPQSPDFRSPSPHLLHFLPFYGPMDDFEGGQLRLEAFLRLVKKLPPNISSKGQEPVPQAALASNHQLASPPELAKDSTAPAPVLPTIRKLDAPKLDSPVLENYEEDYPDLAPPPDDKEYDVHVLENYEADLSKIARPSDYQASESLVLEEEKPEPQDLPRTKQNSPAKYPSKQLKADPRRPDNPSTARKRRLPLDELTLVRTAALDNRPDRSVGCDPYCGKIELIEAFPGSVQTTQSHRWL